MILAVEEIIGVAVICFILCILIYLLVRSIKKEEIKFNSENIKGLDDIIDKNKLIHDLSDYINKYGAMNKFYLLKVKIIDLKNIYVTLKNKVGNAVVVNFVKQVKKSMKNAVIARSEFDTFYIWYRDYFELEQMRIIIDDLIYNLEIPLEIGLSESQDFEMGYKLGLIAFPYHCKTLKEILENLDLAFFCSLKSNESYIIYDASLREAEIDNQKINIELKEGIKNDEFEFFYQPIYNMEDKSIKYAECLLRWKHPTLGILTPDKFMNVFEQTGDINWLTLWGVEELFKKSIELHKTASRQVILNMNLSQSQLKSEDLVTEINKLLRKYKVNAKDFCFEIVEFVLFQKFDIILENIKKLKELGFIVAIDDLGLEYHTLSKLENLPIDIIKLDKKFIEETKNNFMNIKIAEMLVEFSKVKHLIIIAEAIENLDMVRYVNDLGIHHIQGYFISKPLAFKELHVFLDESYFKNKKTIKKR